MLEELLKIDKLGSKDELLFVLFEALPLSKRQNASDLRNYCISNHFSIGGSFNGLIRLLEFMDFITISNGVVSINEGNFNPIKFRPKASYFEQDDFIGDLFRSLQRHDAIVDFIRAGCY